jgi:hypothetical protein
VVRTVMSSMGWCSLLPATMQVDCKVVGWFSMDAMLLNFCEVGRIITLREKLALVTGVDRLW